MSQVYNFWSIYNELEEHYKKAMDHTDNTNHIGKSQAILKEFQQQIKYNLETLTH